MQAQHEAIVSLIVTKLAKIQKECRSRKFRDLHKPLEDAVSALSSLKGIEWPPKQNVPEPPDWMGEDEDIGGDALAAPSTGLEENGQKSTETTNRKAEGRGHEDGTAKTLELSREDSVATIGTTQDQPSEEHAAESDAARQSTEEAFDVVVINSAPSETESKEPSTAFETQTDPRRNRLNKTIGGSEPNNNNVGASMVSAGPFPFDDDSGTNEPMHPAVITSVNAFCAVMNSPLKTAKMAELSLDCVTLLINNRYVSGRAGGREAVSPGSKAADAAEEEPTPQPSRLLQLIQGITSCSDYSSEVVQAAMSKALLALMASPKCGVHEAAMLMAVRATFHVYLVSKTPHLRDVSKATLVDMLKAVFNRMEVYETMIKTEYGAPTTNSSKNEDTNDNATVLSADSLNSSLSHSSSSATAMIRDPTIFASQYHTDGYLLFRALCKLSAKTLPGDDGSNATSSSAVGSKLLQPFTTTSPVDPLALNSKILSLELILSVFENCGEGFRTGEKFIYAVQNYLCVSLLKNCMSNHTHVAYLSLKIFLLLVYKFKAHLKSEIEVFVANIFLRVLESPNSSFEQKSLVLEALRALCNDPQMLTQIFLNYDCDFDAVNLYKDIVHHLTKLSGKPRQTQYSSTKKDVSDDTFLSMAGLDVLVVILRAYLKALGLPGGDDDTSFSVETSSRLRNNFNLDVGLAITSISDGGADTKDDASVSSKDAVKTGEEVPMNGSTEATEDVAGKIVDAFDRKRTAQQNFETGVVKFTLSLKGGIRYFVDSGLVRMDAREIALFFHKHKDTLEKTQIGEALGKEPDVAIVKGQNVDGENGGEGFYFRVLHHYVEAMDFTGMEFDSAIRSFLSGFRLPGEAQKIDRIMEKFAERYTRQNEDVFPSADTAFILAFSVIMLQTDLHNPSIKPEKRMTLESFIRNNRGISVDGGDLPEDLLEGIYDRVKAQPFTLKEDDDAREKENEAQELFDRSILFDTSTFFGASAEDRKRERFRKEREEMMVASEQLFKKRPGKGGASKVAASQLTESVSPADVVKPMFDVTWGPLIGTLSQVLEMANDETSIGLCLNGFVYAVRISSHSGMSLSRDTFINALAKFTTLGSIKEMKSKNIESIRTLLSIAIMDGDYLGESWGPVLKCISQLGRLQLFASGLASDDKFLMQDNPQDNDDADSGGFFRQPTKAETARETEENNGRAVLAAVNEILIDKVFFSTVNLSALSIVHFIEQLVAVSDAEISGNSKKGLTDVSSAAKSPNENSGTVRSGHGDSAPRIFSLQRLVEVADYNMDVRPRLAWAQVWEMMANHFAKIGCHENAMVSMFAIDALRQLSFKFLEKTELSDFNFQRLFLRPFLQIMENPVSREDIRELILRCVDNMIRSMSHNLRSGWKIFFLILTLSSSDSSEKISTLGLAILQRLLDQHLDELCQVSDDNEYKDASADEDEPRRLSAMEKRQRNAKAEDFVGLCRASLSFVQTEESDNPLPIGLSMRALCHTACYADLIASGKVLPPVSSAQPTDPTAFGYTYKDLPPEEAEEMVLWRPLLDGLAAGICSTAPSNSGGVGCLVQRGSVMTLRAILLRHGKQFSVTQWSVILREVIVPAIQIAAEYDESAVIAITSESPSLSSLDFLSNALPLPPRLDDEGLMKFAKLAESEESAPKRPLGVAELLVEASFADLRHGGDGNLSRAHGLAKKNLDGRKNIEQPFPDSWIATTAPIALGMLNDIFSEVVLAYQEEGRNTLWPIILGQLQRWAIGYPLLQPLNPSPQNRRDDTEADRDPEPWCPCEALVRVGCRELLRIPRTLIEYLPHMSEDNATAWIRTLCKNLASVLSKNVALEGFIHDELVESKFRALGLSKSSSLHNGDSGEEKFLSTPYGNGFRIRRRTEMHTSSDGSESRLFVDEIQLEFGGTLYSPSSLEGGIRVSQLPLQGDAEKTKFHEDYVTRFVPMLKTKCVASHILQQYIPELMAAHWSKCGKEEVSALLRAFGQSRTMASKAGSDGDLAHAFQDAMFSEWGDGVEEVEAALASMGEVTHRGGSKMFFLTQEAGANRAMIDILSLLYCSKSENVAVCDWNTVAFAEPFLLARVMDVLEKFLSSAKNDGDLVDRNVWRSISENGGKIALYCTSFAPVVSSILKTILDFSPDQFRRHKGTLYPLLCSLITVQSDEIRCLVQEVFLRKVAPIVGIRQLKV